LPRTSWLDEKTDSPLIDEMVQKLESFAQAMADGVVEKKELEAQQNRLTAAMKAVEGELSDDLHAKVTRVLVDMTAFNIMQTLHEIQAARARRAFGS
jgi:predicted transcriptional regulator